MYLFKKSTSFFAFFSIVTIIVGENLLFVTIIHMTSPIDYQALESQKNSKTYSKEIDKALNVPLSQEERELADLASETEKSQVLKKNIDMTGKIMLDVVRPEALRRLSKIDSKVLDDAIQYLKDNNTEVYTALNAWIHK